MSLAAGTRLGPYEILSPLGAGGMGEVCRARDTRLGRDVAIKVLPAEFAADRERLERFEREARATAALSHANILAVFDIGSHDGAPYIVEELVEGESLRHRLGRGPLPVPEAVDLATQIARGLAAAHDKRIVHRDLKPDNVIVTRDGVAKILDFGLAKFVASAGSPGDATLTHVPTGATELGAVLGTVAYMAPEQAKGQAVDERADVFAFGIVLYEMLSGRRPFVGGTGTEIAAAILKDEPAPLPGDMPERVRTIVSRCLEKRAEDRFASGRELLAALSGATEIPGAMLVEPPRPPAPPRLRRWPVATGVSLGVLAVVVAAAMWLRGGRPGAARGGLDPMKVMVGEFENMTGDPSLDSACGMASDAISQGLTEMGNVKVAPPVPTASGAQRRNDAALRAAAATAGAGTLVSGSIYVNGAELELRGRVIDVASGKLLFGLKPEAAPRSQPAQGVDRVRQRVMGAMLLRSGEAPALGGITTPPLYSAYQEYIAGVSAMGVDRKEVLAHLERAAAIDPEFWHPQIRLMAWYQMSGQKAKYETMQRHLQDNLDKLGPPDRILLQYYDAQLAGRTLETYRKARELLALAPHDFTYAFAAASLAMNLHRPREALECLGDVEAIDWKALGSFRQGSWLLGVAAFSHHLLGDYEAELKVAEFGVRLYPDLLNVRQDRVRALAALGRVGDVDRELIDSLAIRSRPETPGNVLLTAAQELRAHGHADDARRVASRCADWYAALTGDEGRSAVTRLSRFECLWLAERWQEAGSLAETSAKEMPDDPFAAGYCGIIAARNGDAATAAAVDKGLAGLSDIRLKGNGAWMRACIAAQLRDREKALEHVREALAHGLTDERYLHCYVFLEPLHGYAPFEELLKPKG